MTVSPFLEITMPISSKLLRRVCVGLATVVPLGIVGVLSITVLLPALRDPESKVYGSGLGYPALQRRLGQPIDVQVAAVGLSSFESTVAAPGESVALQKVDIRPSVTGIIDEVYVVEGQRVRKGQPLLKLQQEPFQVAVETAQVNLAAAEAKLKTLQNVSPSIVQRLEDDFGAAKNRQTIATEQYNRVEGLVEEGAVSRFRSAQLQDELIARQNDRKSAEQLLSQAQSNNEGQIVNAKLEVDNRRLALRNAIRNLNYTTIYASTDGLVSTSNVHVGEIADASNRNPVMVLSQNIVFKAAVDQAQLNTIKVGNRAIARLVAYPGRVFEGKVIRLNPTVETESSQPRSEIGVDRKFTYSVWVEIRGLSMPPGLQGFAQFPIGKENMIIPEKAVTHLSGGEGMVMVNQSGTAVVKKVSLGRVVDNQREVLAGLKPGEQVVLAASGLNPGDRLNVQLTEVTNPAGSLKSQATAN